MPQPRAFVNRYGKPTSMVTGVSLHKASGRFYIRDAKSKRRYFHTWEEAKAVLDGQAVAIEPGVAVVIPDRWDDAPPADEMPPKGTPLDEVEDDHPHRAWLEAEVEGRPHVTVRDLPADVYWSLSRRKYEADPKLFCERLGIRPDTPEVPAPRPVSVTLNEIARKWREHHAQRHGGETRHTGEMVKRWEQFVRKAGNLHVHELTPESFRTYHTHLELKSTGKAANWLSTRAAAVVSILRWAARKFPEWRIPAEALVWADSYDRRKYQPKPENRRPITPSDFAALVQQCRTWQQLDAVKLGIDTSTQSGRGKMLQLQRRVRSGYQLEAILWLGVNCALDNVDVERIEWANLKLDADVPHMDFARRKVEHLVGQPVQRVTPLLPETIKALQRWQSIEHRTTGKVFRSAAKGGFDRARLANAFRQCRDAAGICGGLSFKSLRNVAPTIAHKKFKSRDLADLILGHQLPTTAKFYIGDLDSPEPLIELVTEVGRVYAVSEPISEQHDVAAPS